MYLIKNSLIDNVNQTAIFELFEKFNNTYFYIYYVLRSIVIHQLFMYAEKKEELIFLTNILNKISNVYKKTTFEDTLNNTTEEKENIFYCL